MNYKWEIDKEFSFEMGHRVWAQKLKHAHLSLTTDCACKHLHGHSYSIKVCLGSNELDSSAMVTDFKNINFMKKFLDENLDHKFMIDVNDPNFEIITGVNIDNISSSIENFSNLGQLFPASSVPYVGIEPNVLQHNSAIQLHRDSFVLVNFVPTSENICRYLKEYAQSQIKDLAVVTALELWETKKSHCRYIG